MGLTTFEELKKQMEELQEKIKKQGQETFFEIAKNIFERYPVIESFGWNQYTPYFCDGEQCEFGVRSDSIRISLVGSGPVIDEDSEEEGVIEIWGIKGDIEKGNLVRETTVYGEPRQPTPEELEFYEKNGYVENASTNVDYNSPYTATRRRRLLNVKDATKVQIPLSEDQRAAYEFSRLISSAGEDVMLAVFGDHAEITIHRDGTSNVEEYSHD